MPIYDYECEKCGYRFERRQNFDADPDGICPRCDSRARRRFHSVAVIYKGSGFYTTDYKRNGYSPPGDDEKDRPKTPKTKASDKAQNKAQEETSSAAKKGSD